MAQMTEQQSLDLTRKAIARAIIDQKPAIVSAMRRNGIIVSPSVSDTDLAVMIFEAMQRSRKFQQDLQGILYAETQMPEFFNQSGPEATAPGGNVTSERRQAWTNLASLGLDAGLKAISNRINQKQAEKDRLAAIQYNASEVERLRAEMELQQQRAAAKGGTPVVTYVVIGAVVIAAVVAVVYVARKK
jgi:hypothetical protein